MDVRDLVTEHYSGTDLATAILAALRASGVDVDQVSARDLQAIDQMHAGFADATRVVLQALGVGDGTRLLDVGSGIGGPARLAADEYGARVTGVDLTPALVAAAQSLTDRVGLGARVSFHTSAGDLLPFPDGSFDAAMLVHVGMNVPDKLAVFTEVHRVLEPGGAFAVYDQMRVGPGELSFPLPWAVDERSSFVETPQAYAAALTAAGFTVETTLDRTAEVTGPGPAGGPPQDGALSPGVVLGPDFIRRIGNNVADAEAGRLGAVLITARA